MGLGHKRWVQMLSTLHIKKKEELIVGGSARSLSDDPDAEHRIFQLFTLHLS